MADQQRNLARMLKELTAQLEVKEKSYEAFAVKIVGGDRPAIFSLSASEVLCEPLFWIIIFEDQYIVQQDIESSWVVQGPLLISFAAALRQQYGPPNEWIEGKNPPVYTLTHFLYLRACFFTLYELEDTRVRRQRRNQLPFYARD